MEDTRLPFLQQPKDALRDGLFTLKDEATSAHHVQKIEDARGPSGDPKRYEMMQNVYGSALPARMAIEKQILNRVERLPGLTSSKLGLQSLHGTLDDFSFESYLNLPADSETVPVDMHSTMEQKLGMAQTTKPCHRGIV